MIQSLSQDAHRRSMNISPADYIPFDELEDSAQKRFAQKYMDEISRGKYLRTLRKDGGGKGLVIYSDGFEPDLDLLVRSLLGTYCIDDGFVIPPEVAGRDIKTHGYPITFNRLADKRARVLSAGEFVDLSREFEGGDTQEEYKELKSSGSPLFLGLLGMEYVQATEWSKDVLYGLLDRRASAGKSTIITTNVSLAKLSERFGGRMGMLLANRFVYPRGWVA